MKDTGTFSWITVGLFCPILAAGLLQSCAGAASSRASGERSLDVTAGRGLYCFSLTNHESVPIAGCSLSITDAKGTTWTAASPRPVVPLETRAVEWIEFKAGDQPLPQLLRDEPVTVSCTLPDQVRGVSILK
jgi:hypothetical protein